MTATELNAKLLCITKNYNNSVICNGLNKNDNIERLVDWCEGQLIKFNMVNALFPKSKLTIASQHLALFLLGDKDNLFDKCLFKPSKT